MASPAHDPIEAEALARVGTTLKGKWHLDCLLGVGGMAAVYAATHRNQKRVAIKVLHAQLNTNTVVRERFLREGYAANSVGHPNAVSVHDDDVTEDGCSFLVMDLLEGETLEARWKRLGKRLPAEEVLCCAEHVLDALVAAHAKGIVHRDLKPENLFLTDSGAVKILDFGIARLHDLGLYPSHTRSGSTLGTPGFMAPEQALGRNDEVDAQSDLWSLGATLFTLLSGRLVHEGGTANERLIRAATSRAPSLARAVPELPRCVTELVDRALAYDKSARWPDAATLRSAVRRALVQLDDGTDPYVVAPPRAAAPKPRSRWLLPGDGLLAASAALLLLASLAMTRAAPELDARPVVHAALVAPAPQATHRVAARARGPEVVPVLRDPGPAPVSVDDLPLAPPEPSAAARPQQHAPRTRPVAARPERARASLPEPRTAEPEPGPIEVVALIENPYHVRFGSGLDDAPTPKTLLEGPAETPDPAATPEAAPALAAPRAPSDPGF